MHKYVLLAIGLLAVSISRSQTHDSEDKPKHLDEHYHLSVMAGYSTDFKKSNGYKIGLEYEYRVGDRAGLAGTFDFTGADFEIFAFSIGASFYPFKFPVILALAGGAKHQFSKWDPFVRTVVIYDFHVGHNSIGPMVIYDIFEGKNVMTIGVAFGISL